MAWFMDTYSVYQGYSVNEIVTGKPVSIGGTEGRRESTGRGVVYLIERAMDMLKMKPEKSTAIMQGFGNVGSVAALSLGLKTGVKVVGISDPRSRFTTPRASMSRRPISMSGKRATCAPSIRVIGSTQMRCSRCNATFSRRARSIA